MKHIKTFESRIVNEDSIAGLQKFYKEFEIYKKHPDTSFFNRPKAYKIPEIFHDEFIILDFLYCDRFWWMTDDKTVNFYIKKQVKKFAEKSILDKIEKDEKVYFTLKEFLDKRQNFNSYNSSQYIGDGSVQYIFFLLHSVIKKVPEWIKDSKKYNL